jgi:hypothetical protein
LASFAIILFPATRSLVFGNYLFRTVDNTAIEYVDSGLKRSVTAFATARAFNAVVSVFQDSDLQLEPGGIGVSLALGQALDPVNDLVERFSWVMLLSLTSLGIQKVLIQVTPFVSIQILGLLAIIFLVIGLWAREKFRSNFIQIGRILLFLAILVRFAVPSMAYLNQYVYMAFLQERHDQSIKALEQAVSELGENQVNSLQFNTEENKQNLDLEENKSIWGNAKEKLKSIVNQAGQIMDINTKLKSIKAKTLKIVDKIIDLIVVFILSTIIIPIIFLWGIFRLGRIVISQGFVMLLIQKFVQ